MPKIVQWHVIDTVEPFINEEGREPSSLTVKVDGTTMTLREGVESGRIAVRRSQMGKIVWRVLPPSGPRTKRLDVSILEEADTLVHHYAALRRWEPPKSEQPDLLSRLVFPGEDAFGSKRSIVSPLLKAQAKGEFGYLDSDGAVSIVNAKPSATKS